MSSGSPFGIQCLSCNIGTISGNLKCLDKVNGNGQMKSVQIEKTCMLDVLLSHYYYVFLTIVFLFSFFFFNTPTIFFYNNMNLGGGKETGQDMEGRSRW